MSRRRILSTFTGIFRMIGGLRNFFSTAIVLVLLLASSMITGGCVSNNASDPLQRVTQARQMHTIALTVLVPLINSGVIAADQATKDLIWQTDQKIVQALDQAEAMAREGKNPDFNFWMNQVSAGLDTLLAFTIRPEDRVRALHPTTRPVARRSPWEFWPNAVSPVFSG